MPDIAYAVSIVSQFMHDPMTLEAVYQILRYLKSAPGKGILYTRYDHLVRSLTYVDWVGSKQDRRSTSGYCTLMSGNLVTWRSKMQTIVSRSTAEAEYRTMALGIWELQWLRMLLSNISLPISGPFMLHCDNQSTMHITNNPVFYERTEHIEVDGHFIGEKIHNNEFHLVHTWTEEQLADIFTKSLHKNRVNFICNKLGLFDVYALT
ncbi:LOW QUALITY PROTEIN: hypothetical protein CFOL_v3_21512 [Cephalotus follicularis]|uniref:UBN2_3 domain-containing protein n=1 Tax=Cephalotus follicularis TaxID=3775 RepID=A0A1Q3CCT2_CEPFO|nr:LOW QUALITY PROTEIN: hypothetical protein CFOL_v3_21512 [Cephalotus follicularis]